MFIGHYGPGFAIKPVAPKAPMWALLGAVQIMDMVWSAFIQLGIEHGRIDPAHALAGSALVLDDMPYTHSLLGAGVISLAFALVVAACVRGGGLALIFWVTLAGLSHWALDLLVHAPDLTLAGAPPKLGLGLWAYKWPEFALEIALVLGGVALYVRATEPRGPIGRVAPWLIVALLVAIGCIDKFSPVRTGVDALKSACVQALAAYLALMACGAALDRVRRPRAAAPEAFAAPAS